MGLLNDFIEGKVCAVVQNVEDQYRLITYLRGIIPECVSNWDSWLARYEDSPDKAGFSGFIHMGMRIGDHFVYQYSDGQSYQEERERALLLDILKEIDGEEQIEVDDSVCFF